MNTKFIGDFLFSIPDNNMEAEEEAKKQAKDLMEKHYAFYGQLQDNQYYVTRGSILCCTAGAVFTMFDIPCDHGVTLEDDSPVGTCSDCKAANNIYDFGVCNLPAPDDLPKRKTISFHIPEDPATNRTIPVTGQKCIPIFSGEWMWKKDASVKIWNKEKHNYDQVLKDDYVLPCLYGGFITVVETPAVQLHNNKINKFVEVAISQKGVAETQKPNQVKYNTWYYNGTQVYDGYFKLSDGTPCTFSWCAVFVLWSADQVDLLDSVFLPTFKEAKDHTYDGVKNLESWYNGKGRKRPVTGYNPKKGDLFFKNGSHVGIVVAYDGTQDLIYTIEGNAGDMVRLQTRKRNEIRSFGSNGGTSYGDIPDASELNPGQNNKTV